MNDDIERFFSKNGINPIELVQISTARIQAPDEVNYIVAQYCFRNLMK